MENENPSAAINFVSTSITTHFGHPIFRRLNHMTLVGSITHSHTNEIIFGLDAFQYLGAFLCFAWRHLNPSPFILKKIRGGWNVSYY